MEGRWGMEEGRGMWNEKPVLGEGHGLRGRGAEKQERRGKGERPRRKGGGEEASEGDKPIRTNGEEMVRIRLISDTLIPYL